MSEQTTGSAPKPAETLLEKVEGSVQTATQVAEIAGAVTGQPEITVLAKLVESLAGQVQEATGKANTALQTAQSAHGVASDAQAAVNGMADGPAPPDTGLIQDIVNFIHWAFPGHPNLPGKPVSAHPVVTAA